MDQNGYVSQTKRAVINAKEATQLRDSIILARMPNVAQRQNMLIRQKESSKNSSFDSSGTVRSSPPVKSHMRKPSSGSAADKESLPQQTGRQSEEDPAEKSCVLAATIETMQPAAETPPASVVCGVVKTPDPPLPIPI
jgi:hypothetical protein